MDKRKLVFTKWGFGVEKISERSIRKNLKSLLYIVKEQLNDKDKKTIDMFFRDLNESKTK